MSSEGLLTLWAAELMSPQDMDTARTAAYSAETCEFPVSIASVLQVMTVNPGGYKISNYTQLMISFQYDFESLKHGSDGTVRGV